MRHRAGDGAWQPALALDIAAGGAFIIGASWPVGAAIEVAVDVALAAPAAAQVIPDEPMGAFDLLMATAGAVDETTAVIRLPSLFASDAEYFAEALHEAFPDRFGVSSTVRAIVEAKRSGVYAWGMDGKPYVDEEMQALLPDGGSPSTEDQVLERALAALAQECRIMLADGIVAEAADIDLCMLLGAGWPFHLGGITPYLARTGHPVA